MSTRARFVEQIAALPWRWRRGHLEVMLVTSRTNHKWLLPKGWLIEDLGPSGTAAREAFEEAGIEGLVSPQPIGSFRYFKVLNDGQRRPAQAVVFGLQVSHLRKSWPEDHQRERAWFRLDDAARSVSDPMLALFLRQLSADTFVSRASTGEDVRLAVGQ